MNIKLELFSVMSLGISALTARQCMNNDDANSKTFRKASIAGITACGIIISLIPLPY